MQFSTSFLPTTGWTLTDATMSETEIVIAAGGSASVTVTEIDNTNLLPDALLLLLTASSYTSQYSPTSFARIYIEYEDGNTYDALFPIVNISDGFSAILYPSISNYDGIDVSAFTSITFTIFSSDGITLSAWSLAKSLNNVLVTDTLYYGIRITTETGFEAIRSDNLARAYFNADSMAFQVGDGTGETWTNKLYYEYDSGTGETNLVFDGTLSASLIEVLSGLITPNLYAGKATIAELTVDQIDTSTMIANYLAEDKSPIGYWKGYDQYIDFLEARYIGDLEGGIAQTAQVEDRNGNPLYWVDAESIGTIITTDVTSYPVMRYVYEGDDGLGIVKMQIFHEIDPETGYATPKMRWGAGTGIGDNGKGYMFKQAGGLMLQYFSAIDGTERHVYLNDDTVDIIPSIGGGVGDTEDCVTLLVGLDANKPAIFSLTALETIADLTAFQNAGGVGYSFSQEFMLTCRTDSNVLNAVTRGGVSVGTYTMPVVEASGFNGIEFDADDEAYIWMTNFARIYKFRLATAEDVSPATTTYSQCNGMAAPPGDYIYFGQYTNKLIKARKDTGAQVAEFTLPFNPSGVAYDWHGHLIIVGYDNSAVIFDLASDTVAGSASLPYQPYNGATHDGYNLWLSDNTNNTAVRFGTTYRGNMLYFATDTNRLYVAAEGSWHTTLAVLTLGETSDTAYRGDRGKIAYDHSQVAHAPADAQKNSDITIGEIEAKLIGTISSHTHPQATASMAGIVKAIVKTTETLPVAIETSTGQLYVNAPDEAANGLPAGGTAGQILYKLSGTDYAAYWSDPPAAGSGIASIWGGL